jgi:predicted dehydrogenase
MSQNSFIVVGYGHLGAYLTRFLTAGSWGQPVAVVDPSDAALRKARADTGLGEGAVFRRLDKALATVEADVALVNTPSEQHYAQSKAALEAGLHVLVAKPITNSFPEAVRLVELARAKRRTLCVGQQIRYMRHYVALDAFVRSGKLGRVEVVNFLNTKPRHTALNLATLAQPALYEMSCHHFDSLLAVLPQARPESIVVDGYLPSWSVYRGPCMVNALIRLSGGVHVLYHAGFSSQADCYELRLEGTLGALRCRGIHMSVDEMTYEFALKGGPFERVEIDRDIAVENPWQEFFTRWRAYVDGGEEPPFSGRNNLAVFALLSAGIDSMKAGRTVNVAGSPRYRAAFQRKAVRVKDERP